MSFWKIFSKTDFRFGFSVKNCVFQHRTNKNNFLENVNIWSFKLQKLIETEVFRLWECQKRIPHGPKLLCIHCVFMWCASRENKRQMQRKVSVGLPCEGLLLFSRGQVISSVFDFIILVLFSDILWKRVPLADQDFSSRSNKPCDIGEKCCYSLWQDSSVATLCHKMKMGCEIW